MPITTIPTPIQLHDLEATKATINALPPTELTELLLNVAPRDRVLLFRLLEKERALQTFELLPVEEEVALIQAMEAPDVIAVLEGLDPDDAARLFEELPASVTKRLLARVNAETRTAVNILLGYPDDSAGRVMNPHYVALPETYRVAETLEFVRHSELRADQIEMVFVISPDRRYRGYVRLGTLIKADPQATLAELLTPSNGAVKVTDHKRDAALLLTSRDLPAVAVVDREERLVGAITFDDVLDLIQDDASETMYWKAGIGDASHLRDEIYSRKLTQGSIWYPVRIRIMFLLVTMVGGLAVGGLIENFEEVLAAVLAAAIFIPLVMDMGGNVGTQSTTIFARGLALGHIQTAQFRKQLAREVSIGVVMGVILGTVGGTIAFLWQGLPNGIPQLGIAVGVSLFMVVALATFLGFTLPWLMLKLGLDHAPGADPFITTIKDFTGLSLYFFLVSILIGVG